MTKRNNIYIDTHYLKSKQKRAILEEISNCCKVTPLKLNELQSEIQLDTWSDIEDGIMTNKSPDVGYSWYTHASDTCNVCTDGSVNLGSVSDVF